MYKLPTELGKHIFFCIKGTIDDKECVGGGREEKERMTIEFENMVVI